MWIAGAVVALAIPFFIMLHDTHGEIETAQSLCPFKFLTGLPCPGCGITKAFIFIYKGDLTKSLCYHLFGVPAFVFCIGTIIVLTAELITKKEFFNNLMHSSQLGYALGFFLAGYHLIRLIHFLTTNSVAEILRQSVWA